MADELITIDLLALQTLEVLRIHSSRYKSVETIALVIFSSSHLIDIAHPWLPQIEFGGT